jgi:nitroreductase
MEKHAPTQHPVHPLIKARWSPRSFQSKEVPREDLMAVREAARWAASCFNAQPWRFLVATRDQEPEAYEKLIGGLNEFNQAWAGKAPVVVVITADPVFSKDDGRPNKHSWYDTGAAVAQLTMEATHRGLSVHQMGGIEPDKLRAAGNIPASLDIICALVIGYAGHPDDLPEAMQEMEKSDRQRDPFNQNIIFGAFEQ